MRKERTETKFEEILGEGGRLCDFPSVNRKIVDVWWRHIRETGAVMAALVSTRRRKRVPEEVIHGIELGGRRPGVVSENRHWCGQREVRASNGVGLGLEVSHGGRCRHSWLSSGLRWL